MAVFRRRPQVTAPLRSRSRLARSAVQQAFSLALFELEALEPRRLFSLTHLYTFNDGTANDSVGTANAALFAGATVSNGRLQLQNAGIVTGSSSSQYAKIAGTILPSSGSATIEAWYNADSSSPNGMRIFDFGNGSAGQSYIYYSVKTTNNDSRAGIAPVGGTERTVATTAGTTYATGNQTMAAVVVDSVAATISLYINGTLIGSTPLAGIDIGAVNETLAYLGRSQTNNDACFSGSINEVRIYNEALASNTIAADDATGPADFVTTYQPAKQVENLDRGIVALPRSAGGIYVSWRLLATDPSNVGFNLYRSANNGAFTKLNSTPLTVTTDYQDTAANRGVVNKYYVKPVINGVEQAQSETFTFTAGFAASYLSIPLVPPDGGTTIDGSVYTYNANDCSVGDVDGDGQYEIILKWDPSNSHDNSQSGYTGNTFLDCYKLNGTRLWRIDLGQNIRAGAHYTQFMVYDLDGDGKAEVATRTAPGTIDGVGNYVLMGNDNPLTDYRNSSGYNLTSPEYLTIFNGLTGAQMISTAFTPNRVNINQWGDTYGNRGDRILMAIAYLDGQRPSLVVGRGIFPGQNSSVAVRNEVAAFDYRGGTLTQRWWFKAGFNITNNQNSNYVGQGTYDMQPTDVDGDGKDEIVYGSMTIDDDGRPLYSTEIGHGDALHTSDMDPTRPGMEVFMPHETPSAYGPNGGSFRSAETGEVYYPIDGHNTDVGRGVAFDVDPNYLGYEAWTSSDPNMYNTQGQVISVRPSDYNFGVWWDADPGRELLDGNKIDKWNWTTDSLNRLVTLGTTGNNGTKNTPGLSGDILGDWREEVVERTSDNLELRIYSTTIPATNRLVTLMQDIHYREAIAWQNVGYNQPPHPDFYLGFGMAAPPAPNVYLAYVTPVATSIAINGGAVQRSMVSSVTIVFNTVVSFPSAAVTITLRLPGGFGAVMPSITNPLGDGRTWVLGFGPSLADGVYDFKINAPQVKNVGGLAMATDVTRTFHRLFGDSDGNAAVDNLDLFAFRPELNNPVNYNTMFDSNSDGHIDNTDLTALRSHLGTRLVYS